MYYRILSLLGAALLSCDYAASAPTPPRQPGPPDTTPPVVQATFAYPASRPDVYASVMVTAGEELTANIRATDARRVAWVGWETQLSTGTQVVDYADSVAFADSTTSAQVQLTFRPSTGVAGALTIRAFARDGAGLRSSVNLTPAAVSVYAVVAPTLPSAPIRLNGDIVYDAKRQRVYLTEPDSAKIRVLSSVTMAPYPSLTPPGAPRGADLTPSGDSLIVTLENTQTLGILNLADASAGWSTMTLPAAAAGLTPLHLRIGSTNRALLTLATMSHAATRTLLEHDFSTGTERVRTDLPAALTEVHDVFRTFARGGLIVVGNRTVTFDVTLDRFERLDGPGGQTPATFAADTAGERYLLAGTDSVLLTDRGFNWANTYGAGNPVALSARGDSAFFGYSWGTSGGGRVRLVRLSDGVVMKAVSVPALPVRLMLIPGPHPRLLSFGWGRAFSIALDSLPGVSAAPAAPGALVAAAWSAVRVH